MPRILVLCTLYFSLQLICTFPVVSQSPNYRFDQISTGDGLSGNRIYAIIQDSRGFVWIATGNGLNRYNGYEVTCFDRPNDPEKLSKTMIVCLYEDKNGIIWIGTAYHGLYAYDPVLDNFYHYSHDPEDSLSLSSNNVISIYQDKSGVLWIGTGGGGLNRFNSETGTFDSFRPIQEDPHHSKNMIVSMFEDDQGILWIGTYEGIYYFDRTGEKFLPFDIELGIPENHQIIFCFHQDKVGNIWFGTLKGLFKYEKGKRNLIKITSRNDKNDDHLDEDVICAIQPSNIMDESVLWIATRNGLINYNMSADQFSRIVIDPITGRGLSNNSINDIFINNTGILWIATAWSGVNKLDTHGNPFKQIRLESTDSGTYHAPLSFCMDKDGFMWVSTPTGGLFKFNQQMRKMARYFAEKGFFIEQGGTYSGMVDCMFEGSDQNLWVCLGGWGPAIFDREKESFIYLDIDLPEGYSRPARYSDILEDQFGTIWFATDALYKKDSADSRYDPIKIVDDTLLNQTAVFEIYEDSKANVYFGTYKNGIFCLRLEDRESMNFCQYGGDESTSPGLYKSSVNNIYEDIYGNIWATSNQGLNKFNPELQQFELIQDSSGLFDDGLYEILGDQKGFLWLGHYTKGLLRYQPGDQQIKIFDSSDGLPFDHVIPKYWYQSEDGRIFIGGWLGDGNGFFYFHPDSIADNMNIPPIVITDFKVENKPFEIDSSIATIKHIRLKYNQNFFSFQFAALDYSSPGKNKYAYYMKGLDEDWIYSGTRRFANYTSVPPGKYTFRVKGSNNDGYWNEEGVAIQISILPPPWKTWWAYCIYGILLIGLIYAWRRYDLKRQHLKQELEIEHVEAEKLKELDSMKSRFFANISHEFRTPLTLILGPLQKLFSIASDEETKKELNLMQRNAKRLQNLINQLLDLSKLESGKMKLQAAEMDAIPLIKGYVQSFESLAKQKRIDLVFKAAGEKVAVAVAAGVAEKAAVEAAVAEKAAVAAAGKKEGMILVYVDRDKIEKILYNLLSNAFKFTGAGGSVSVAVSPPLAPPEGGVVLPEESVSKGARKSPPFRGDGRGVLISVSNTGPGIPQEELPHIFDRFYQTDDSYTKDSEGTGIGLALTKELVELHHGEITVKSEVGKGTTFTVFFPLGKEHLKPEEIRETGDRRQEAGNKETMNLEPETLNFEPGTLNFEPGTLNGNPIILIVEDNADLRQYIRGYLDQTYNIIEAENGRQGLDLALEHIPDMIVSDVMMPEMDGIEMCRKIKEDIRTSHIPIILLTARASIESKLEGLETGADDYLYKPFNHHELIIRVHNMIEQKKKIREYFIKELNLEKSSILVSDEIYVSSMEEQFLAKVKKVVEENMSDPDFNVDTFAKLVGMSRSQLHRKLTALINLSPSGLIRSFRLSRAAQRLKQKSGSVSEIAFDVGFGNLSYFSRCFQEEYGVLPSEYTG